MSQVTQAFVRAMARTAKAGFNVARTNNPKKKRKRRAKSECTPCAAIAMVADARERVDGGM